MAKETPPAATPRRKLTPEDIARINARFAGLGKAMAAGLNYNVALEDAGKDPSKWTPEQTAKIEALRAELVAANKPADETPAS